MVYTNSTVSTTHHHHHYRYYHHPYHNHHYHYYYCFTYKVIESIASSISTNTTVAPNKALDLLLMQTER